MAKRKSCSVAKIFNIVAGRWFRVAVDARRPKPMSPENLAGQMTGKPDQELLDMCKRPSDWSPEALEAAKLELQKRNIRVVQVTPEALPLPANVAFQNADYVLTTDGRKHFLKATTGDIILSIILPGWGVLIGLGALFRGEKKRAVTMVAIGACILFLVVISGRFH